MPVVLALADVAVAFPTLVRGWPREITRDGWVPWKLFFVLAHALHAVRAGERMQTAQGVALGIGEAFDGQHDAVRTARAAELKRMRGADL